MRYNEGMSQLEKLWKRILASDEGDLTPEVARFFLSLGLSKEDDKRYQKLASMQHFERNQQQQEELENLVHVNTLLMTLQSKARLSLKKRQPAA